jgi:hypothetical protein
MSALHSGIVRNVCIAQWDGENIILFCHISSDRDQIIKEFCKVLLGLNPGLYIYLGEWKVLYCLNQCPDNLKFIKIFASIIKFLNCEVVLLNSSALYWYDALAKPLPFAKLSQNAY